jgi:hypothetical protein
LNSTTGAGFAAEVAAAFEQRGEWLVSQGLAERSPDGIKAKPRLLATLTARELVTSPDSTPMAPPMANLRRSYTMSWIPE